VGIEPFLQDLDREGNNVSGYNTGSGGDDATSAGDHGAHAI